MVEGIRVNEKINENIILNLTKNIVKYSEMNLLSIGFSENTSNFKFIDNLLYNAKKYFWYPIQYIQLGARDFFRPLQTLSIIMTIVFLLFSIFNSEFTNLSNKSLSIYFIFIIPVFLVIFSIPTTYAFYNTLDKEIQNITSYLKSLNINDKTTIEYIELNLEKTYRRVTARHLAYKWFIGSIWFISIFFITVKIRISSKIVTIEWSKVIQDFLTTYLWVLGLTLCSILVITFYKRASDILFRSIEISLIELKYQIDIKEQKKAKRHAILSKYKQYL